MSKGSRRAYENRKWTEGKIAPTMVALGRNFGIEEQCEERLISLRWPGGFACPRCGGTEYRKLGTRRE